MGPSELACARCGRHVPVDELSVWQQYEQHLIFQGPAGRDAGPEGPRMAFGRVRKHCAYLTCQACHERLEAGGGLDDIHNRKVALYTVAVVVVGVLIVAFMPVILPRLLIAFWWW
jgi:hypothetical protein